MNARLLSFALLWPIALGSVEVCSAAPPAAVQFRGETASPAGVGTREAFSGIPGVSGSGIRAAGIEYGGAISIASGDFNGDGIPDFVVGQSSQLGGSRVTVFLGRADGTIGKGTSFAVNHGASYVAVGDFNHDGKLDTVVANPMHASLDVLRGNGDGTFRAPVSVALPGVAHGLVVADFNGDGWDDVAVAGSGPAVYVLLNNRHGSLVMAGTYSISGSGFELAAADLNHDGKLDLCVAMTDSARVAVLLGKGDGTFSAVPDYETGILPLYGIAIGDLTDDGNADLVVSAPASGKILVASGNGDGTFNPPVIYAASLSPFASANPLEVALRDVNGDGYADIVYTNSSSGGIGVLLNDGLGHFYGPEEFGIGEGAVALAIADLNKDGWADVVTAGPWVGGLHVLYNATGSAGSPAAQLSVSGLSFGNQQLEVTSARRTFILANPGGSTLSISSIEVTGANGGDFSEHNNCGSKLPAGGSCNINVTFTPSALGPRSAAVVVTDDGVGSSQHVGLAGTGGVSVGRVTPSTVAFGGQVINSTSAPSTVTLLNNGNYPMNISSVTITGEFSIQTNTCAGELNPGVSCTVAVVFTPTQLGSLTGTLIFVDDASNSPQTANLTGTGETNTTSTKLTANPNPVVVGHVLTLTAHVTATYKGTPTGTVTFYDGGTALGTATLSAGVTQFTTSSLTAGSHSLTAVYGGDSVFQGSTSAVVTEQVNQEIATVTVVTSATPVYIYQNVVFTASVSADGGIVATGTMSFQQGSTSMGTVPLVNGQANVTLSFSTANTYRVTATYSGDQNYKANSSYVDEVVWWDP
ncbi:MAG: FG-GAP-like repeat-containing protein [Terriglobales bacterium]